MKSLFTIPEGYEVDWESQGKRMIALFHKKGSKHSIPTDVTDAEEYEKSIPAMIDQLLL